MSLGIRSVALFLASLIASSGAFFVSRNSPRLTQRRPVPTQCSSAQTQEDKKEALRLHVFDILQTNAPWTYEEIIRAEVCSDLATRLVRWHISGPGSEEGTLAVEAVTFDADYRNGT